MLRIKTWVALAILAFAGAAWSADGKVSFVSGSVAVYRGGQMLQATRDMEIRAGDRIVTSKNGRIAWEMSDQSRYALRPNTDFTISEYRAPSPATAKQDNGRAFFKMVRGGFRIITGLVGKLDRKAWTLRTPTATMGIRGTTIIGDEDESGFEGYFEEGSGVITNNQSGESTDVNEGQTGSTGTDGSTKTTNGTTSDIDSTRNDTESSMEGKDPSTSGASESGTEDGTEDGDGDTGGTTGTTTPDSGSGVRIEPASGS